MNKRALVVLLVLIVLAVGWYLFRPERLIVDSEVSESFPAAAAGEADRKEARVLLSGRFHSVAHETTGLATVYQLPDGKRVLRLTDFKTSNGPDVQVYLVSAPDANDNQTVTQAGFLALAPLKGNIGDQNYELPESVDLAQYQSVSIWCRRFGVNFATAPLTPPSES
jgi:hypothetical protein